MAIATHPAANKTRDTAGLRAAIRILENWGATQEQGVEVLRISRSTYNRAKRSEPGWEATIDRDQLTRISMVLNIHAALRTVFENPANLYGFMTMPNHNQWFEGRTPLDTMISGGFPGLYETFKRIDGLRGAQW
ncbi:antitoxin Xre-like helix-turn-helix domain-containing protein [Salinicola sp. V024]|uniref:antitoxin Xre-like helix-turn-helix domain-containing protein n=1 Tax=Salinicola sp. V024 TaxID=3459609 RepID=UPI004044EA7C